MLKDLTSWLNSGSKWQKFKHIYEKLIILLETFFLHLKCNVRLNTAALFNFKCIYILEKYRIEVVQLKIGHRI